MGIEPTTLSLSNVACARGSCFAWGGRAKADTLKDWCSGRRSAPKWFIAVLDAELAEREKSIREARSVLAAYQFGRGHGAGLRDWWRDRRYAEIEAARKNYSA